MTAASPGMKMYDVIIVGAGPAGLCAALYSSRSRLSTLVLEKAKPGGQASTTEWLENYPGFPEGVNGPELMELFAAQAREFGAEIVKDEVVSVSFSPELGTLFRHARESSSQCWWRSRLRQ
jgi:thioredoxin reductase (NADPH)